MNLAAELEYWKGRHHSLTLENIVHNQEAFEETGFVDQVVMPLGKWVYICPGFMGRKVYGSKKYDVIEVYFEEGFVLETNKHLQREVHTIVEGILHGRIWDKEGNERKVAIQPDGSLSFEVLGLEPHEVSAKTDGIWVSVLTPPITKMDSWWRKLISTLMGT